MMINSLLSLRVFSSEKLIVITLNKVASRYVSLFFKNDSPTNYEATVDVDSEFNIMNYTLPNKFNSLYKIKESTAIATLKKEWDEILNKKNKKDILFLYREPYERTISGISQEFLVDMENVKNTFITKLFVQNLYDINTYHSFLNDSITHIVKNEKDKVYELYSNFIKEYIKFESIALIKKHHVRPYLIYLYDFLKNHDIDRNKLFLLNIDDSSIDLESFLNRYELERNKKINDKTARGSNNEIKQLVEKTINDFTSDVHNRELYSIARYIENIIEMETVFFEKIKKLPQNIKDEI